MARNTARHRSALTHAVAAQIRAERAAAGLTQDQVVDRSGIPKSTYVRLESGDRVADVYYIAAFCDALGMSGATLMQRAEERAAGMDPTTVELLGGMSARKRREAEELRPEPPGAAGHPHGASDFRLVDQMVAV